MRACSQLYALPVRGCELCPLLKLLLVLYELLLLDYSAGELILQLLLVLEARAEGHTLVPDQLVIDRVDGYDLPQLVVDRGELHENDTIEEVPRQFVLSEELGELLAGQEGLGLLGGARGCGFLLDCLGCLRGSSFGVPQNLVQFIH